ncbi:MAG: hypothetical protein U9Q70_07570, partial [Chloroflexota bacterium]|nr:hypothetical protein [Chloroflexota bacterium]
PAAGGDRPPLEVAGTAAHVTPVAPTPPAVQRLPAAESVDTGWGGDRPPLEVAGAAARVTPPAAQRSPAEEATSRGVGVGGERPRLPQALSQLDGGLLQRLTARGERRLMFEVGPESMAVAEKLPSSLTSVRDAPPVLRHTEERSRDRGVAISQPAHAELGVQRKALGEGAAANQPKMKLTADEFFAARPLPAEQVPYQPIQELQRRPQTAAPVESAELNEPAVEVELASLLSEHDLENLAGEIYPIIKRILRTELERHSRHDLDL